MMVVVTDLAIIAVMIVTVCDVDIAIVSVPGIDVQADDVSQGEQA